MERLQKFIANSGYASRRKAEELIEAGRVKVDGKVVTELGTKVSGNETVEIDGGTVNLLAVLKDAYELLSSSGKFLKVKLVKYPLILGNSL